MENQQGLENITGQMEAISKEHSKMVFGMARAFGKEQSETVTNTKESTKMIRNQGMEYLLGEMEIFTKGIMKTILGMVMEKCTGMMVVFTKVTGPMELKMAKVSIFLYRINLHGWIGL